MLEENQKNDAMASNEDNREKMQPTGELQDDELEAVAGGKSVVMNNFMTVFFGKDK